MNKYKVWVEMPQEIEAENLEEVESKILDNSDVMPSKEEEEEQGEKEQTEEEEEEQEEETPNRFRL